MPHQPWKSRWTGTPPPPPTHFFPGMKRWRVSDLNYYLFTIISSLFRGSSKIPGGCWFFQGPALWGDWPQRIEDQWRNHSSTMNVRLLVFVLTLLCMCKYFLLRARTTEMRVCDLLGSCLVGKCAFIPQLHNHQDIYSHMRWGAGW